MAFYEGLIGLRYLRSAHRRGFVSFVALMSVLGLTLGVAVLIVVLSVMNGFERELRTRILSVTSHATLMGLEGTLPDWRAARLRALAMPGVMREAIPAKMMRDTPLPIPRSVICSPSHMRNIEPQRRVSAVSRRKPMPGS